MWNSTYLLCNVPFLLFLLNVEQKLIFVNKIFILRTPSPAGLIGNIHIASACNKVHNKSLQCIVAKRSCCTCSRFIHSEIQHCSSRELVKKMESIGSVATAQRAPVNLKNGGKVDLNGMENAEEYRPGGYHPVTPGNILGGR